MKVNLLEMILPLVLPIVAKQADEAASEGVAEDVKRTAYTLLVACGTEGAEALAKLHNGLPAAAFHAAHAEAVKEFEEAGIGDVPAKLDGFVTFEIPAA